MTKVKVGDKAGKANASVTLASNTVHRRNTDMAENVKQQLLLRVRQCCYCALQDNESTDTVSTASIVKTRWSRWSQNWCCGVNALVVANWIPFYLFMTS
jgi:hypothetical protein